MKSSIATKVTIDPVTRLEVGGRIEILLDEGSNVANAYLQISPQSGFEKLCEGRPVEELPRIIPRICGACSPAHHMAATKAVDAVYQIEPSLAARKIRELSHCAHMCQSHIAHFYTLAAPDFALGPAADLTQRNILGLLARLGAETRKQMIKHHAYARGIQVAIGGKATHPVGGLPGGMSKAITAEERKDFEQKAMSMVEFGNLSLRIFNDMVLRNDEYKGLLRSDAYTIKTYYMGLVDANSRVNFYDGDIRVVDLEGAEVARFQPADYLNHIAEHTEPWSYLKFPFLRQVEWKGFVAGKGSGVYRVGPLARLIVADGMATRQAQTEYDRMYATLGIKPVHNTLAMHWARLIELLYAAERMVELCQDVGITNSNVRAVPTATPDEGVGVVEAPQGTLYHHYQTDEKGVAKKVNLITATEQNNAAMNISLRKAAQGTIQVGKEIDEGSLNMIEMALRAY